MADSKAVSKNEINGTSFATCKVRYLDSNKVRFAKHGARFLGEPIPAVEHIAEQNGRLASSPEDSEPVGQVVR